MEHSTRRVLAALALASLAACSPEFNWRDATAPGGEYRIQLPAKPSTMSRPIHLEALAVTMTMVGARVGETAFTVATVPAPRLAPALPDQALPDQAPGQAPGQAPDPAGDRFVRTMREQMLRNIGAPPETPSRPVRVPLVDADGRRVGDLPALAVSARGEGAHAGQSLEGIFVRTADHALQALVIGPEVAAEQRAHFFGSLQVVQR